MEINVIAILCILVSALSVIVRQWLRIRELSSALDTIRLANHVLRKSEHEGLKLIRELQQKTETVDDDDPEKSNSEIPVIYLVYRPAEAPPVDFGATEEAVIIAPTKETAQEIAKDLDLVDDDWYDIKSISDKTKVLYVKRRSSLF